MSARERVSKKEAVKASWMRSFEEKVIKANSKHAGKLEWDTATHFFNLGLSPSIAADKYIANRK